MVREMITLQVGQCGNQLGKAWFDRLDAELGDDSELAQAFFRISEGRKAARCVLVDTEPRAIGAARGVAGRWSYTASRRVCCDAGYRGAANNWACGFLASEEELHLIEDAVRKEVEACDKLDSFVVLGSGGGGTGSGLGSRLATQLRDSFPQTPALHCLVLPYSSGEVSIGSFNSALSLAHLTGDDATRGGGVLLLQNDAAHRVARSALGEARPDLSALNGVFAAQLVATLPPLRYGAGKFDGGIAASLRHLCSHPSYRVLTTAVAPIFAQHVRAFDTTMWGGVLCESHRGLVVETHSTARDAGPQSPPLSPEADFASLGLGDADAPKKTHRRRVDGADRPRAWSLANVLKLYGDGATDACESSRGFFDHGGTAYAPWGPEAVLSAHASEKPLRDAARTAALLSNSQLVLPALRHVSERSRLMLDARAFVHHYTKHGLGLDDLQEALRRADALVENYESLAPARQPSRATL
mmetsp:Transcript_24544/g.82596  ORF Transcript_24544/g.82596 Transcript_24544/m.82596 type:complete len:471 (+) Transcript_24544:87-1499(+)